MGRTVFIKDCNAFLSKKGFCRGMGISIRDGRIANVGKNLKPPGDARVYDAKGAWTTPGLIDGHTHMGLKDTTRPEKDYNEHCEPVTPFAQVIDAINPREPGFQKALLNGVTTVMVLPGSSNVFGGLGALMKTYGTVLDKMVFRAPAAMKMALGANPKKDDKCPSTRMGTAHLMRKVLLQAREYQDRRRGGARNRPGRDIGLENILEVLSGRLPARIHCHRADDIMTALRISAEFGFDCCLEHATEGYLVAEELAERGIPCFIGPTFLPPGKQENQNNEFSNAARLREAGVKFAIVSDYPVLPSWYLSVLAGVAVREGLSEDDGLRAVTSWPAEIMKADDRAGVLAKGADADIVLWDRHPLFLGKPWEVFASGEPVIGGEVPMDSPEPGRGKSG